MDLAAVIDSLPAGPAAILLYRDAGGAWQASVNRKAPAPHHYVEASAPTAGEAVTRLARKLQQPTTPPPMDDIDDLI